MASGRQYSPTRHRPPEPRNLLICLNAKDDALEPTEIDLKEIIAILKRQRRLIVVSVAVILGLAFAYLLAATPIYRATTLVQVDA